MPIVQVATAYQREYIGLIYILIFSETLWMGESMQHTLINPKQLWYSGTKVQDDPISSQPLHIMAENAEVNM